MAVLGATRVFGTMNEDGYAMPASAGVAQSLSAGGGAPVSLVKVQYEDTIYSSPTGYFVGDDRRQIDAAYPLYTNGGTGLRFLSDDKWLITSDVDVYQSFEGMYLSEGVTYNEDMSKADEAEFIFTMLPNGLYMNAQWAVFSNAAGDTAIPNNSIIRMSEDSICWYEQKNGTIAYRSEDAVFGSTITIGEHTYNYTDLLDALGLTSEAVKNADHGKPDEEKLQEAEEILNRKDDHSRRKSGSNAEESMKEDELSSDEAELTTGGNDDEAGADKEQSTKENDGGSQDGLTAGKDGNKDWGGMSGSSFGSSGGWDSNWGSSGSNRDNSSWGSSSSSGTGSASENGSSSGGSGSGGGNGSGGGSGSAGSGSGSTDSSTPGTGSTNGSSKGDHIGGSGSQGSGVKVPYQKPEVSIEGMDVWSYALGLKMKVDDPSGAIVRGISFSVYKTLKGNGSTTTNAQGYKVYPGNQYEGKNSMLRKSKVGGSQEFALSTLEPGRTVYLQYSFRYNAVEKDEAGKEYVTRKKFNSDLIEIKLPTVKEGNVKAVGVDWKVNFAARSDALVLNDLTIANTSDYKADSDYNFDNFKLNTLPYARRMELVLTPEGGGQAVTVGIGTTVLGRAQNAGGTSFTSSIPALKSNQKYICTKAIVKDRFGNEIPLTTGSQGQDIYTRKTAPSVIITEKANVMDSLTIGIEVVDPDGALKDDAPLRLSLFNKKNGEAAALYGQWDTNDISAGGENVSELELKDPKDGKNYELKFESLAFSCLYSAQVYGDYSPQPDNKDAPAVLPAMDNALLGSLNIYTASLSSGRISFRTGIDADTLKDTSATMVATMTSETTQELLPLVDEFRFILKDKSGKEISRTVLTAQDLSEGANYSYDTVNKSVELQAGSYIDPNVVLYGTEDKYSLNPWYSFMVHEITDPDSQEVTGYTEPMQLRIAMPEKSLTHFTDYSFSIEAVVRKSGQEYYIPVNMTNNHFMTKKTLPVVQYNDLFLAADVAVFMNLKVFDPDETILDGGNITVYLYYGNTILAAKHINAATDASSPGENLRFDGLIEGGHYSLQFVASAYNDAEGFGSYKNNYILKTIDLVGGSALSGSLAVKELTGGTDGADVKLHVKVDDLMGYLGREGEDASVTLTIERSDSMELPEYEAYKTLRLPLTKNEDGSLSLDEDVDLTGLSTDDGWRATLSAAYQGSKVPLDQISFNTDNTYISVSTHKELRDAQVKYPYGHILVTSDFTQDKTLSAYQGFHGTIDFQGHVVTKTADCYNYFLYVNADSKVCNLVYDYPETESGEYVNNLACFSYVYGTVENIIIRTKGTVVVKKGYAALLANAIYPSGTVRNYIVHLGGYLIAQVEDDPIGVIVNGVYGVLEDGYIYADNGTGFVGRGYVSGAGLFCYSYSDGKTRNLYTVMNSGYQRDGNHYLISPKDDEMRKTFYNIYSVGDFYTVEPEGTLIFLQREQKLRMRPPTTGGQAYQNVWALTGWSYPDDGIIHNGTNAKLYDIEWQNSILNNGDSENGAFDVDSCVSMGFYPRLKLPTEMQKYQEYLPLPVAEDAAAPKVVSDSWSDIEPFNTHDLDKGYIKLRLKNDRNVDIRKIAISGLISEVKYQKLAEDGLYDVVLQVEVDPNAPEYVSAYDVTVITYADGTMLRTAQSSYKTSNIDFWKSVASTDDWAAINNNMKWNYKLTDDIDFSKGRRLNYAEIVLNGTTANFTSTGQFTGKLDGQEHILKNIRLENIKNPYLIYYLGEGSVLKDLFVEDMVISSSSAPNSDRCGLVGNITKGRMENVRMKNCSITGGGYLGMLVGDASRAVMDGCSVADSSLTDCEISKNLFAGGLAGRAVQTNIKSCYTRDLTMDITHTTVINSVGGLAGYLGSNSVESCYAHGTIKTNGSYVGGINGTVTTGDSTYIRKSWSYVDILQSSGDYAGGISGRGYSIVNTLAIGNVSGAGSNTDRIEGIQQSGAPGPGVYAYKGQIAAKLTEDETGRANGLLTGEQLGRPDTWQDKIRLGESWDYAPVKSGCAPKLKDDCMREGWQQEDIPLPGQGSDPQLKVEEAIHDNKGSYYVKARLTHPGVSSEAIIAAFKSTDPADKLSIELNGMDISDAAIAAGKAKVELGSAGDSENATLITITTTDKKYALDAYALNVKYTDPVNKRKRDLTVMVNYTDEAGNPYISYWEISNLDEWNSIIPEHGQTGENIKITGIVDFGSSNTKYKELLFNRLEGGKADCSYGFANLNFSGGGLPWITKISMGMKDLSFRNMNFNFTELDSAARAMTGAIINVAAASNLKIDVLNMYCDRYTRNYFAFISTASGPVSDIDMKNVNIEDWEPNNGGYGNYASGLVAFTSSSIENVSVDTMNISMPKNYYVGGVMGSMQTYGPNFLGNSIRNFKITGRSYVGGLTGMDYSRYTAGNTAEEGKVTGYNVVGGLYGYKSTTGGTTYNNDKWLISKVDVTATGGCAGGAIGYSFHAYSKSAKILDCNIKGTTFVGGFEGGNNGIGTRTIQDLQIVGCTIENTVTDATDAKSNETGTGGVYGAQSSTQPVNVCGVTIRDCKITGPKYVGGFIGTSAFTQNSFVLERVYVAEDVEVTSRQGVAGGLIGYAERIKLSDCACGATVKAGTSEAGGIIGHAEPQFDEIRIFLKNVYYKGSVSAGTSYAGGIIGKLNSNGSLKVNDDHMDKVLVAADVSAGNVASLWINNTNPTVSAGSGWMYICEDSLINGQTAKNLVSMDEVAEENNFIVPKRADNVNLMISAAKFADKEFYKSLFGSNAKYWDYSDLTTYMPYTRNYAANAVQYYTDHDVHDNAAGILLPKGGPLGTETVVYTSGINSINIEKVVPEGQESVTVNVNGTDYTSDANGVVSLYYNFDGTALTVDGLSYDTSDLSRKVMTFGKYWYYIDKSGFVHYGEADYSAVDANDAKEHMKEQGKLDSLTDVIHLWQGYALDKAGNIYSVNGNTAVKMGSAETNLNACSAVKPIWRDDTVQVYYYFTLYKGTKIVPYRVFMMGDKAYTVSASQNTVFDSILLSTKMSFGEEIRYFGLLDKASGSVNSYLTAMKLDSLDNDGIIYTSNNLGYSGTVMLCCYGNDIVGVDYSTGALVCDTRTALRSFAAYARRTIAGTGLFGDPNLAITDGSFYDGENLRTELLANGHYSPGGSLPDSDDGTGVGDGAVSEDEFSATGADAGDTEAEENSIDTEVVIGDDIGVGISGDAEAYGEDTDSIDGSEIANGSNLINGTGTDDADNGTGTAVSEEEGDQTETDGTELVTGNSSTNGSGNSSTNGSGSISTNGSGSKLDSVDSEVSASSGTLDAVLAQNEQTEEKEADKQAVFKEIFGEAVVAYSDKTGKYELLDTESLSEGKQLEAVDALSDKKDPDNSRHGEDEKPDEADEPNDKDKDDTFAIAWGINRSLDTSEKQGFVLIALASLAGIILLITLFVKAVRKRKK